MQQALTSSVYRSIAVGGLLLALTLAYGHSTRPHHGPRLRLHAIAEPHSIYLSAWRSGDIRLTFEPQAPMALTFTTRASLRDGCRWLGTETLEPLDARHYLYRYDETILGCDPGAEPYRKTPRSGIVSVED